MSTFVVNGQTVTAEKNKKLLRFLRDDLGLTSVKDGCSEGACGAVSYTHLDVYKRQVYGKATPLRYSRTGKGR